VIIDPGIFDLAHSKGIGYLTDINGDGHINQADIDLTLKAKAMGQATAPVATPKAV
jgi:hypothetical protein